MNKVIIVGLILAVLAEGKVWTPFAKTASCKEDFCYEETMKMKGEIVAFADYDDDRTMELILVDETKRSLKLCQRIEDALEMEEKSSVHSFNETIRNVVAGDILFRGQTDLLVQTQEKEGDMYHTFICYHHEDALKCEEIQYELYSEINVFDVNGDNYLDIIAQDKEGNTLVLISSGDKQFKQSTEYKFPKYDKKLPVTFADINGDCRPDLIFVTKTEEGLHNVEFYITSASTESGKYRVVNYTHHSTLPTGLKLSNILVSDFTRNGNLDIILTTTDELIVVFNQQKILCESFVKSDPWCRAETNMCVADDEFKFDMNDTANTRRYTLPETVEFYLVNDMSYVTLGDYNIDSYPDLMIVVKEKTATNPQRYVMLLKNDEGKNFTEETIQNALIKEKSINATSSAFFDIGNRGMLNLFFNVYNEETDERYVEVISNNMKPDAYFMKIGGLNGVCITGCDSGYDKISPKPYGSMYFGGIFKIALTNTKGKNVGMTAVQMSQTTHNSLQLPYVHVGLGRISNYVQVCEFGTNMNVSSIHQQFQSIIPNSQLVVIPHPPLKSGKWTIELYFLDLNLMFWIAILMTASLIVLGIVMAILFFKDKKAEQKSNLLNMK